MPKLTDTQAVLLSAASQRHDGSLYSLPDTITADASVTKAVAALLKRGLIEERECADPASIHRTDGDLSYGVFVTDAGLAAIGIATDHAASGADEPAPASTPRQTKSALVLALLAREGGACLAELIAATGWLPHTTRAALTGLRKKGHDVVRSSVDGETRYSAQVAR